MSFVKVSDLLSRVAERSGDPVAFDAAVIVERVQREISSLLGERAVGNVRVKFYKDHVLTLQVPSSVWASDVRMRERMLLFKIAELLGQGVVRKIRYSVGTSN